MVIFFNQFRCPLKHNTCHVRGMEIVMSRLSLKGKDKRHKETTRSSFQGGVSPSGQAHIDQWLERSCRYDLYIALTNLKGTITKIILCRYLNSLKFLCHQMYPSIGSPILLCVYLHLARVGCHANSGP